jgi:hypothetical protein
VRSPSLGGFEGSRTLAILPVSNLADILPKLTRGVMDRKSTAPFTRCRCPRRIGASLSVSRKEGEVICFAAFDIDKRAPAGSAGQAGGGYRQDGRLIGLHEVARRSRWRLPVLCRRPDRRGAEANLVSPRPGCIPSQTPGWAISSDWQPPVRCVLPGLLAGSVQRSTHDMDCRLHR